MAQLTVTPITTGGVAESLVAASAGGDSFLNSGRQMLAVKNAGTASITVTVKGGALPCNFGVAGTPAHDLPLTVPNDSVVYLFGPFQTVRHNDATGQVQLAYSAVANVTVGAFAL